MHAPKRRKVLACFVASVAVVGMGAASAQAVTPELQKVIDAAKKEGRLELNSGSSVLGGERAVSPTMAGIKRMFGVDLAIRLTPGPPMGAMGNRIRTEFRAGQKASTEIWTAAAAQAEPLLKIDMFLRVAWDKLLPGRIRPELIEGDGRALRITTGLPGIIYNMRRAPEFAKVMVMEDLLKPEFKGKFATTPYAAIFDVMAASSVWGEGRTIAYMKKLGKQIQGMLGCGGEARVASGEFLALALDCLGDGPFQPQYKGVLALQVLRDNAQKRVYYVLIPKHAQNPNAAILYTVFMSTVEGQRLQREHWGIDLYEYPETRMRREIGLLEKQGIEFRDISVTWWAANKGISKSHRKLIQTLRKASR